MNNTRLFYLMSFMMAGLKTRLLGPTTMEYDLEGLKGTWEKSRGGLRYVAFEGIRYGEPPVGRLRFKDPVPVKWNRLNTNEQRRIDCIYASPLTDKAVGQEDCLFLNVYTPVPSTGRYLPVLIWFHGTAFLMGMGGSSIYGPQRLMDRNLVLVIVSYRQGPLGYASKQVPDFPGNYGYRDQYIAVKWAIMNIVKFGGDPGRITLGGHGLGAVDIMNLLQEFDEIKNGIALSGTILAPWTLSAMYTVRNHTENLIAALDCDKKDGILNYPTLNCMRNFDAAFIVETAHRVVLKGLDRAQVPFRPVLDWSYLIDNPFDMYSQANKTSVRTYNTMDEFGDVKEARRGFNKPKNLLVGVTRDEASVVFAETNRPALHQGWYVRLKLISDLPDIGVRFTKDNDYGNFMRVYQKQRSDVGIINLLTDTWFNYPAFKLAEKHKGNIVTVMFNYTSKLNHLGCTVPREDTDGAFVGHGDELPFIFAIDGCDKDPGYDRVGDKWVNLIAGFLHMNISLLKVPEVSEDPELYNITHVLAKGGDHPSTNGLKERMSVWWKYSFLNA